MTQTLESKGVVKALASFDADKIEEGYRLVRIIAKKDSKGNYANGFSESKGVEVQKNLNLEAAMKFPSIQDYLQSRLEDLQDSVIGEQVRNGASQIYDSKIGYEAMVEYLERTDETIGKLSKEKIEAWFKSELVDTLTLALAEKLGVSETSTEEDHAKLERMLNAYAANFKLFSAKEVLFDPVKVSKLEEALKLASESPMTVRMRAKLNEIAKRTDETAL